jgi:hypothetical protein
MSRCLVLVAVGGLAAVFSGCYEPVYIPPKPTPEKIVRQNAAFEIQREFGKKADLKAKLGEFLEKLGDAETTLQLRAAWAEVYPDHVRVINNTISKSLRDFYWPVGEVDGRVYVEGFREAAEDLRESANEQARNREKLETIAHLLEQAYTAFDERLFDKTIKLCEDVIAIDPRYTVAAELKEDAQNVRHRGE